MNSLLLFLLKSTLSLSFLYMAYRLLMRRETFFKLNRMVLLFTVLYSMIVPFLYFPHQFKPIVHEKIVPVFQNVTIIEEPAQNVGEPIVEQLTQPEKETIQPITLSRSAIFNIFYLSGVSIAFLLFVYSVGRVLVLFRKARKTEFRGIRLMIVAEDIPAFSFGRNILISQSDYENNSEAIITHEQSHIRMGHFYDLMLMELVKIIFWFNPLVYLMLRDLKEIHEFQADNHTLTSGIDATKYQLLIIQKSVGPEKFALANSFNHCQIKNRIVMMNNQKTSKAWRWKVATFLPLLALLLMAFGKPGEKKNPEKRVSPEIVSPFTQDTAIKAEGVIKFTPPKTTPRPISIEIKQEGIYLMKKPVTLDEFRKELPKAVKNNPQSEVWINIIDNNNSDVQAVSELLKKECDSKKVKYLRHTVKFTPPVNSKINIPESNNVLIQSDNIAANFTIGKEAFLKGTKFSHLDDSLLRMQKKGAADYKDSIAVRDSMKYWYQKADSSFGIVTRFSPEFVGGHIWKGRMDHYLDPSFKKEEAKKSYEKALAIGKKDPVKNKGFIIEAYKYLGYYYYMKSEKASGSYKEQLKNTSKDYWMKILALEPNDRQANKIIESLSEK